MVLVHLQLLGATKNKSRLLEQLQRFERQVRIRCRIIDKLRRPGSNLISISGWMDKENVIYIDSTLLFSHRKEGNLVIGDNINETWGHYAKWNKSEKRYSMTSMTCGIQKVTTKKQSYGKRDQICGYQRWGMGNGVIGWKWSKGTHF